MRRLVATVRLSDCEVETFRAGGKGGQHQNKRDSAARVRHRPSGAVAESREQRSQLQNKKKAFVRMAESKEFQAWARKIAGIDQVVRPSCVMLFEPTVQDIPPEDLKIEMRHNGHWVEVNP